jgi:parallel beta-helix repeat protein
MKRKWLAVGIILLFVGTCIIPAIAQDTEKPLPASRGNWLYVGGNGPGNFTKIQDAIDNASAGDTVFVYDDSAPYNENINVNKLIYLYGEDRNTTTILGYVHVRADFVTISNFTIEYDMSVWGSSNVTIRQNNVKNIGLDIRDCSNVTVSMNALQGYTGNSASSLEFWNCSRVNITGNTFTSVDGTMYCCALITTNDCIISDNIFTNSDYGLLVLSCARVSIMGNDFIDILLGGIDISRFSKQFPSHIEIRRNNFINVSYGISLSNCRWTTVVENNFINTSDCMWFLGFGNVWDKNYWGRPRLLPKPIYGWFHYLIPSLMRYLIPGWFQNLVLIPTLVKFDWHPAQEPYDIP